MLGKADPHKKQQKSAKIKSPAVLVTKEGADEAVLAALVESVAAGTWLFFLGAKLFSLGAKDESE